METKRNVGFRFDPKLLDRLDEEAKAHGWGLSEEVRRRLEDSFGGLPRAADERTGLLLRAIAEAAQLLDDAYGPWHQDAYTTEHLAHAVAGLVRMIGTQPADTEPVEPAPPRQGSMVALWNKMGVLPAGKLGDFIAATTAGLATKTE